MTRMEVELEIMRMLNQGTGGAALLSHDQAQRDEIARLRKALASIKKIRFLLGNDPRLNHAYEMGDIAQAALDGKEAHEVSSDHLHSQYPHSS